MNEARVEALEVTCMEALPIDVFGTFLVSGAVCSRALGGKILCLSFRILSIPRRLANSSRL